MSRRLGQHFLNDESAAGRIVASAGITRADRVLEIGPGKGALTSIIAREAGDVAAVEIDENLCGVLSRKFAGRENVRIICGDFLDVDLNGIFPAPGKKLKVLGNIPYYITSPILEKLFSMREGIGLIVLTVQKEVAERMCSGPGSKRYGALSVFVASNAKAGVIAEIGRGSFSPPPGVDSAAVRMEVLEKPPVSGGERKFFSGFVKSMFAQKRKMLHNALQRAALLEKDEAVRILVEAGVDPALRPERVSVEQYVFLFRKIMEKKN